MHLTPSPTCRLLLLVSVLLFLAVLPAPSHAHLPEPDEGPVAGDLEEADLADALAAALKAYAAQSAAAYTFHIKRSYEQGPWAYAIAGGTDARGLSAPYSDVALLARHEDGSGWTALAPTEQTARAYNAWLASFPESLLNASWKAYLRVAERAAGAGAPLNFSGHKLPWPGGERGTVTSKDNCICDQGCGRSGHENQVDFAIPRDVVASRSGTVVFAKETSNAGCCDLGCWQQANIVVVQHASNEYSWYFHLAYNSVPVSVGDHVEAGAKLGEQGETGYACGAHLHYMASTSVPGWTDPNNPNAAPWPAASSITPVDFAEASWGSLALCQSYTSQNGSGSTTLPAAPSWVTASDGTYPDRVGITWASVTDATRYDLYRSTSSSDVNQNQVRFNAITETGYEDTSATSGTHYWYWVTACNSAGCSKDPGGAGWGGPDEGYSGGDTPQIEWTARYDQGTTCWWDPNCSMTPRCTEMIRSSGLDKDWGSSAPCAGMNADDWVADMHATVNLPSGSYVFQVEHDDGVKLFIEGLNNGNALFEAGGAGTHTVCSGSGGYALGGTQQIRVLLREEGGSARVKMTWSTDTTACQPTRTATPSATATRSATRTPTATATRTATRTPTGTVTRTATPSATPTVTPSLTPECAADGTPPAPAPVAPPHGAYTQAIPMLRWEPAASPYCVDYYNLRIIEEGAETVHVAWPGETQYQIPEGVLAAGKAYAWWVWAHNSQGFGPSGRATCVYVGPDGQLPDPGAPVAIYQHAQYEGLFCSADREGSADLAGPLAYMDDQPSSIRVAPDWSVRLFSDPGQSGSSRCFSASEDDFWGDAYDDGASLSDTVSSYVVYHRPDCGALQVPAPPRWLSASKGAYAHSVHVQWSRVDEATHYTISRSTSEGGSPLPLGQPTSLSYDDTSAIQGKVYYYWVEACNAAGCSTSSGPVEGYRQATDPYPYPSPSITPKVGGRSWLPVVLKP